MTRPDLRYVTRALRATAREAIWAATCRHVQGDEPNIFLFATRRGGSTFAMELIAANRGVRPMNQPLETQSDNLTMAQALEIPRFGQGQITSLDDHDAERLRVLVERIFAGEVVINAPTKFWRRDVDFVSNRIVLKLTDCKPVIGWFDETFDADIVYLTRHPIPQSLSCIRNAWTLTAGAHLDDPRFVDANLDDAALALSHDILAGGDELQKFCLNWALENVAPIRLLPTHPNWLHVRYEDCAIDPEGTLRTIAERLRLHDVERMNDVVDRPSQSSRRSTSATRAAIESGDGRSQALGWRDTIGVDDERRCNSMLEALGIDPALLLP